ncbi:MAG: hypothetical protein PVG61_08290 [Dehalococcoidia bacterium]|jgi:hypothetical protein
MSESLEDLNPVGELKKLSDIATDMQLDKKMRNQAISQLAEMDTHEALLILLHLAANDKLPTDERELAVKKSRDLVKKGR